MKVVHICTSLDGGAGLCASRIIRSTRALGVDVKVLVAQGEKAENIDVVEPTIPWSRIWPIKKIQVLLKIVGKWPKAVRIQRYIGKEMCRYHTPVAFTSPITLYKSIANHPWVEEADIVHLHWIGNFVDYESFFSTIDKPLIWTIHDQNPGLGGFHLQIWKDNAADSLKALDDELVMLKGNTYKRVKTMTLVAISTWMGEYFQKNALLRDFPFTLIHNGIEETCFTPLSRLLARKALGLPAESTVFLFVAQNIDTDIKGLKELIDALEILNIPNMILICVGRYQKKPTASFEIRCENYVCNNRLQSIYYSAADYFVMPSFHETFAQVPMEAMACGTPVIAFPCSGTQDLINEGNGVICEDFTVDALVKGIKLAMSKNYDRLRIRADVVRRFSYSIIGQQYVDLYHRILAGQKG